MKHIKLRFLALCGLVVLAAAAVAPIAAQAGCPTIRVLCGSEVRLCTGTQNGNKCDYSADCLNC